MNRITITFLLFFLLLSTNTLTAQSKSFPTTQATWRYNITDDFWNPTLYFDNYYISGDTIINDTTYQSVNNGDLGFFRTVGNKVFYLPKDSTQSILLYDFDLEEGDFFLNKWGWGSSNYPDTLFVGSVDSILLNDGYRKIWSFTNSSKFWIEGIGNNWSVTHPNYEESLSGNRYLFCFRKEGGDLIYENSVDIYDDLGYNIIGKLTCEGFIVSTEDDFETNDKIKVHPNPFDDHFEILSSEISEGTPVQIFSLTGQLVKTIPYQGKISIPGLAQGTYILSFTVEEKQFSTLLQKY